MHANHAITFLRSMLMLAFVAACADQPVMPRAAAVPTGESYTVGDPLNAFITGPTTVAGGYNYTWYANSSGGDGTYTYQWHYQAEGSNGWTNVGIGSSVTRRTGSFGPSFNLRLTVISAGTTVVRGIYVTVEGDNCGSTC